MPIGERLNLCVTYVDRLDLDATDRDIIEITVSGQDLWRMIGPYANPCLGMMGNLRDPHLSSNIHSIS